MLQERHLKCVPLGNGHVELGERLLAIVDWVKVAAPAE
jgi:hypothetical protein